MTFWGQEDNANVWMWCRRDATGCGNFWRLCTWWGQWWSAWTEEATPAPRYGILAQVWHPVPAWIPLSVAGLQCQHAIWKTLGGILSLPTLVMLLNQLYLSKLNPPPESVEGWWKPWTTSKESWRKALYGPLVDGFVCVNVCGKL